jgi:hypothetical protein
MEIGTSFFHPAYFHEKIIPETRRLASIFISFLLSVGEKGKGAATYDLLHPPSGRRIPLDSLKGIGIYYIPLLKAPTFFHKEKI